MEEKILTKHPQGKQGFSISKARYDLIRETILQIIRDYGEISFTELLMMCEHILTGKFSGSISWYATKIKLDLEARGEIERVPSASPQKIRLKQNNHAN